LRKLSRRKGLGGESRLVTGAYRFVETVLVRHTIPSLRSRVLLAKGSMDQNFADRRQEAEGELAAAGAGLIERAPAGT
jgi:hypothetical protein